MSTPPTTRIFSTNLEKKKSNSNYYISVNNMKKNKKKPSLCFVDLSIKILPPIDKDQDNEDISDNELIDISEKYNETNYPSYIGLYLKDSSRNISHYIQPKEIFNNFGQIIHVFHIEYHEPFTAKVLLKLQLYNINDKLLSYVNIDLQEYLNHKNTEVEYNLNLISTTSKYKNIIIKQEKSSIKISDGVVNAPKNPKTKTLIRKIDDENDDDDPEILVSNSEILETLETLKTTETLETTANEEVSEEVVSYKDQQLITFTLNFELNFSQKKKKKILKKNKYINLVYIKLIIILEKKWKKLLKYYINKSNF